MLDMSPLPSVMACSTALVSMTLAAKAGTEVTAVTVPAMHRLRNEATGLNLAMRYPVMKAPAKNAPNHTDQSTRYALRNML